MHYTWLAGLIATGSLASVNQPNSLPFTSSKISVKFLGVLPISEPGSVNIIPQENHPSLVVSSFRPAGAVSRVTDIESIPQTGISKLKPVPIPGLVPWPNNAVSVPIGTFGIEGLAVAGGSLPASGSLAPGISARSGIKPTTGMDGIYFSPLSSNGTQQQWIELFSKSGWVYQRVVFADLIGDGYERLISCRALISGSMVQTMLVSLQPQDLNQTTGPWIETELGAGCSSLFTVADLNGDGKPEVIAASYLTNQLNIFYTIGNGSFDNTQSIRSLTINHTAGRPFDVQAVDLNGNGRLDLLVSSQGDGTGSVSAFEVPVDFTQTGQYVQHTLAAGFPVIVCGGNRESPGSATVFAFQSNGTSGLTFIAVSGGAAQFAYVLVPTGIFQYETTRLYNCDCTVGQLAVSDVDGDGRVEIIVPCYENSWLAAFTVGP